MSTRPQRIPSLIARVFAAAALCAGAWLAGCTSGAKQADIDAARANAVEAARADASDPAYILEPGDELAIRFFYNEELDAQVIIRPDGSVALSLIGEVQAAGHSIPELTATLREQYEPFVRLPDVTVNVLTFGSRVAYVGGEVRRPGVVGITPRMTVLQCVMAAGGATDAGDFKKIVVVRDQGTQEPLIMMLDLDQGIEKLASMNDLTLHSRDIVFVPKTGIARANQFVREYIRDLLPIQSSFNLQYQFTNFASLP
ncbi:MAG: polysaccharide export protein [Phycisphaerales bacterium]|nr:polysaccharide export protein [Phycisphaerales bacterium]